MTPRKAIYTPEEAKTRQIQRQQEWNKENTTTVNIRLSPEDKTIYTAYAEYKGVAVARMFRACAEVCMRLDGWTYQPEAGTQAEGEAEGAGKEDQPGEDQAEEQAQQ